jgi:tetratricopeptide (TPR) repeat protein
VYTSLPSVSNGDLASAERAIRKALQLSPGNALAHYWGGGILAASGLHEEALAHLKQAIRLQPLAIFFRVGVGAMLYLRRKIQSRSPTAACVSAMARVESDPPTSPTSVSFASPKSSNFTSPLTRTITFAGFKSRCRIPAA